MSEQHPAKPKNDELDPELIALAGTGSRPSILRPILMIAVIVLGGWIISDWRPELEYFVSGSEPVSLGDATDLASVPDAEVAQRLGHNKFVSIRGIPTQRSQSARYRFFRLVGAPVFVEDLRDDYIEDPLERELKGDVKGDVDRTVFEGSGRILKFSEMPSRYHGLRHYYRTRYNITFCEELTPAAFKEIESRKRDAIIAQWRAEYEEASPERRQQRKLTEAPTDEQLAELLADDPVCVEAWLLQDGVKPTDHWWYVAAAVVFLLFMLVNVVLLVKWAIAFARS